VFSALSNVGRCVISVVSDSPVLEVYLLSTNFIPTVLQVVLSDSCKTLQETLLELAV
jgi:hypothetical protein